MALVLTLDFIVVPIIDLMILDDFKILRERAIPLPKLIRHFPDNKAAEISYCYKPKPLRYEMVWRKYFILRSLLILVLFLTGCATPPTIDLSKNKVVPERESVVFGRIIIIYGGKPITNRLFGQYREIFILNIVTSKTIPYYLTGDGSFYWHLTPGEYAIVAFTLDGKTGRIFAEFTVSEEKPIMYIGKLTVTFSGSRYYMRVDDDYDLASLAFNEKFPRIRGEMVKSLMRLEKPR